MTRVPIEEKKRIAAMLSHKDRPLQQICNMQYSGLVARKTHEREKLQGTTAIKRALAFFAQFGQAASLY